MMSKLVFLGTGGGRFAAILQARATGGLYVEVGEHFASHHDGDAPGQGPVIEDGKVRRFHIDPGPGALAYGTLFRDRRLRPCRRPVLGIYPDDL